MSDPSQDAVERLLREHDELRKEEEAKGLQFSPLKVPENMLKGDYVVNFVLWDQRGHWSRPASLHDRHCIPLKVA